MYRKTVNIKELTFLENGVTLVTPFALFESFFINSIYCNTKYDCNKHIRQSISNDNIYTHQKSVNHKTHKPNDEILNRK